MELIGRYKERERLNDCLKSDRSELVIIYGRRRIGKTFLIEEFFKKQFTFYFVGSHNQSKEQQLANFAFQLQKTARSPFAPKLGSWNDAFRELQNYIESLKSKSKKVIFFDEMPWIDTQKSGFVPALETFWNSWATFRDDIMFVACGSATSWIVNKIIKNRGGLHGRTTAEIYLRPFNLKETEELLNKSGFCWDRYQIAQAYMALGGVPYYYTLLNKRMSLVQNIDELFFSSKNATLKVEFTELFALLFKNSDKYIAVVKTLSQRREGYTRTEISKKTGIVGAGLTNILENLERCDFIFGYSRFNGGNNNV
ncbi:MAG: ATP-binding protein, partial [Bacteroidales bacterium]|nr:ATP-binding protein [Bacteroidales bacterium]